MKAIFDTKARSAYDDEIAQYYHFPSRYLSIAEACVNDWIIFREPRADGGSLCYFATAKISRIVPDPELPNHYYALMDDYFQFDVPVPWTLENRYWEEDLRSIDIAQVGVFMRGKSIRNVNDSDFHQIVVAGLKHTLAQIQPPLEENSAFGFAETSLEFDSGGVRKIIELLVNRKVRDASFRRNVLGAYEGKCAFTGLKILDGRGNFEVQAAHIKSVADNGPDILRNGLALSSTAHWMFDRHLLSLTDDYRLLIAESRIPDRYLQLLRKPNEQIYLPEDERLWPSQTFVEGHRNVFSQFAT